MEKHNIFQGIYFSRETVIKISSMAKTFSWVVAGVYSFEWIVQVLAMILQITRGYWNGMGFTDVAQSILILFEPPLRGVVYFIVLQAVKQALLMFMDIEDNTRRSAQNVIKK